MNKLKSLNTYQKALLWILLLMVFVFGFLYFRAGSQEGYRWRGEFLSVHQEKGNTVYRGKLYGKDIVFTVVPHESVTVQYGDQTYDPFLVKEDPTAIPKNQDLKEVSSEPMKGVEVYRGTKRLFRGGVVEVGDAILLYDEEGSIQSGSLLFEDGQDELMDETGNVIETAMPTVEDVLKLVKGPKLTQKADWGVYIGGVVLCLATALFIFFADELFYLALSFRVQDPQDLDPSRFELFSRYLVWTLMTLGALVTFIVGLR